MTTAEAIRNAVEDRLAEWCREGASEEEPSYCTSTVVLARSAATDYEESGIRYQRCGGGRRVIRKTGGGA